MIYIISILLHKISNKLPQIAVSVSISHHCLADSPSQVHELLPPSLHHRRWEILLIELSLESIPRLKLFLNSYRRTPPHIGISLQGVRRDLGSESIINLQDSM
ncbi:hypothetical protein Syun_009064 [Stephania yunnanensis]|uniref:Uncharacterized protein n=1 Tax=Stephania yunnanensis TaxID=152371 RepID=A0AAP0KEW4_9MAGN